MSPQGWYLVYIIGAGLVACAAVLLPIVMHRIDRSEAERQEEYDEQWRSFTQGKDTPVFLRKQAD